MRGFLIGSMALVVLYVALQPGTADKIGTGSNVLTKGLQRLLSGDIAGFPDTTKKQQIKTSSTTAAPAGGIWI